MWLSYIGGRVVWDTKKLTMKENSEFTKRFECDNVGGVKEYMNSKVEHDYEEKILWFAQPVMLQSFGDEFKLPTERKYATSTNHGSILVKRELDQIVKNEMHAYFEVE